MLRAYSSLLPPISTPSLFSLIPSLSLSSPLREPLISPVKNQTALSKALLIPNSPHSFQSFSFKGLSPMVGRHQFCPRGITGLSFYLNPMFFCVILVAICYLEPSSFLYIKFVPLDHFQILALYLQQKST